MRDSATEIANLLYRYAELIDGGDLEGAAALFRHARIKVRGGSELIDEAGILALWRQHVRIYPCGTPRTSSMKVIARMRIAGRFDSRASASKMPSARQS